MRQGSARLQAWGGRAAGLLIGRSFPNVIRAESLKGIGGNADVSSRVQRVIAFEGLFDMEKGAELAPAGDFIAKFLGGTFADKPQVYRNASPIRYVSKDAPPFLFLHGTADTTVPIEQSRTMQKKLRESGVQTELCEVEGAEHSFLFGPPHYEPMQRRMEALLDKHFRVGGPRGGGR
jgi:acetyl esterase/lipase